MWKKSTEISRKILFGHTKELRIARGAAAIALALLVWISPPYGAVAGGLLYFLLAAAVALLPGSRKYHYTLLILLAALVLFLIFPRSDQIGAIGLGLLMILFGIEAFPLLRKEATLLAGLECLLPILLGITFIASCRGSFTLSSPFYGISLLVIGIQNLLR